jgi:class 3 adenylate cyclase
VTFAPGWDRLDPFTLRFAAADVERRYEADTFSASRRRQIRATLINVPVWAFVAIFGPAAVGVPATPVVATSTTLMALILIASLVASRAKRRLDLDLNGIVINSIAGIGVVGLADYTGTFDRFAALGLAITGIVALSLYRLRFVFSLALVVVLLVVFVAVGVYAATALVFQCVVLAVALGFTCWGTYQVEASDRHVWAQSNVISELHRRVNALFHQYLSPQVAESLLSEPARAELGGEVVEVTVLFADLTGFTPFSERTAPSDVVRMLNTTLSAAVPIVFAEGGSVIQFAGDALMAVFNAPLRQPDHALRAARAALAVQRAVATLPGAARNPIFRIGLNSGPALVGNIGTNELRNFTAIGDTTNLASRLQTFARPGSVVIGQRTRELLGPTAQIRALGAPELKGKSVSTPAYELLGLIEQAGAAAVGATRSSSSNPS